MQPHLRPRDAGEILDGALSMPRVGAARTPPIGDLRVGAEAADACVLAGRPAVA